MIHLSLAYGPKLILNGNVCDLPCPRAIMHLVNDSLHALITAKIIGHDWF